MGTRGRVLLAIVLAIGLVAGDTHSSAAQTSTSSNPHGRLPEGLECSACHTTSGWSTLRSPLAFDHQEDTSFPLYGRHAETACNGCHLTLEFAQPEIGPNECSTCHLDVHQGALVGGCASCHNTTSFQEAGALEQHARTRFPLDGAHIRLSCAQCHRGDEGGVFAPVDAECLACHTSDFSRGHEDLGGGTFETDCKRCHSTVAWGGVAFDHSAVANGFALEGRHQAVACEGCHTQDNGLRFAASGTNDCIACHEGDYQREHGGTGFPTACSSCHTVNDWEHAAFDHLDMSSFQLVGAHTAAPCGSCHDPIDNALLFPTPASDQDCVACHQAEYDANHSGTGFSTACASCHTASQWTGATFDHADTGFPLVGAHTAAPCASCHDPTDNALLFPTPASDQDCVACHQADYDANHAGTGFSTTCASCHTANQWTGATFDHADTGFPLVGAHTAAPCTSCHDPADNSLLFPPPASDQDCVACHQADYDANHAGTGFPTTCASCHTETQWTGATFDHNSYFPIYSGKHASLWNDCQDCHPAAADYAVFTCMSAGCHTQSKTNNDHSEVSGYAYDPVLCLECHPRGN